MSVESGPASITGRRTGRLLNSLPTRWKGLAMSDVSFEAMRADTERHLRTDTGCRSCAENVLALIARIEAAEAKVARVREVSAQIKRDDEESLDTYGQHLHGAVLVCAEMIDAALDSTAGDGGAS